MKSETSSLLATFQQPTTHNGAPTLATSSEPLVDFFFGIGSARYNIDESVRLFSEAFRSNQDSAIKLLFYSRDIRGGQGHRKLFRTILTNAAKREESWVLTNIPNIPFFGRWDDLFSLMGTPYEAQALVYWANAIREENPLACKWAPREKSSRSNVADKLRRALGMSPRNYRKALAAGTKVVETQMCAHEWDSINYSSVPSRAMNIYKGAFSKHSPEKWSTYIEKLTDGIATINSSTLYPHEIAKQVISLYDPLETMSSQEQKVLEAQWKHLPDFLSGSSERILPVVDTSGSMFSAQAEPAPITVSISLGIYIAERNTGKFANHYMTFSQNPTLMQIDPSQGIISNILDVRNAEWGMNTDISRVFETIHTLARNNDVPEEDMPSVILIISDMEFDAAASYPGATNYSAIKQRYAASGYKLPKIVFWNINASPGNVPVRAHDENTLLVGGFSPSIMKHILKNGAITPLDLVMEVINDLRYESVKAYL